MPSNPTKFVAKQPIELNGAPRISYPYGTEHRRIERLFAAQRQTPLADHLSTVPEFGSAVLTQRSQSGGDQQKKNVYEVYEDLPSPWIYDTRYDEARGPIQIRRRAVLFNSANVGSASILTGGFATETTYAARDTSSIVSWQTEEVFNTSTTKRATYTTDKYGVQVRVTREIVQHGTQAVSAPSDAAPQTVTEINEAWSERVTTSYVDSAGNVITAALIKSFEARSDEETGVTIHTDSFLAVLPYTPPFIYTAEVFTGPGAYVEWKQPAAGNIGYGTTSYSSPHYPIAFRVGDAEGSLARVEVDHCRKPLSMVSDQQEGFRFPAIYDFNRQFQGIPEGYSGKYAPPFNIGADQPYGFSYKPPRQNSQCGRRIRTYTIGRTEALPVQWKVISPGAGSKYFREISENTIHPACLGIEESDGTNTNLVEKFPASTPSTYSPTSILTAWAQETRWRGEIWCQEVMLVSEDRPLSQFPDPATAGFYIAVKDFEAAGDVPIDQPGGAARLYALTKLAGSPGTETVVVTIDGGTEDGRDTEDISAVPSNPVASLAAFRVGALTIDAPTATDDVVIYPAVDPDTASIRFIANPLDGDTLTVGKTGSPITYTFRTSLSGEPAYSVKIFPGDRRQTLNNLRAAVKRAVGYAGKSYSAATTAHPDVTLNASGNPNVNTFATLDPTTNDVMALVLTGGGSYYTSPGWMSGGASEPIATIPQGKTTAYNSRILSNPVLLDSAANNDSQAVINLPALTNVYTNAITTTSGNQHVTLRYNALGDALLYVWWMNAAFTPITVTLTNGSTTFTPSVPLTGAVTGDYILVTISGTPTYLLLTDATHLASPWAGTTGSYSVTEHGHKLPNARNAQLRVADIGLVNFPIRLRLAQDDPPTAREVAFRAEWPVVPS